MGHRNQEPIPDATLTWNTNGKYTARWVRLKIVSTNNVFLQGLDELDLPIAHAEGRLVPRDPEVLSGWFANDQVGPRATGIVRTTDRSPAIRTPLPPRGSIAAGTHNPNGLTANIAGLGDPSGRVLGLMPHPERFPARHPAPPLDQAGAFRRRRRAGHIPQRGPVFRLTARYNTPAPNSGGSPSIASAAGDSWGT
ncbi:MAG: hypothetical protein CM1200mP2_07770 [Planctomycetaceae bacterium]|nr:MAG: hypothetical protein CM1200mP2_07770 [Planctomycetaceae bacterium]